jgi:hypothetical protein
MAGQGWAESLGQALVGQIDAALGGGCLLVVWVRSLCALRWGLGLRGRRS